MLLLRRMWRPVVLLLLIRRGWWRCAICKRRGDALFARCLELPPSIHLEDGSHAALRDVDAEEEHCRVEQARAGVRDPWTLHLDVGACTGIAVADTADVSCPTSPARWERVSTPGRWLCAIRCKRDELIRALIASASADTEEGKWPRQGRPDRSRLIITAHELDTAGLRVECVLATARGREGNNLVRAVLAAVCLAAGVQCIALLRGLSVHVRARSASARGELTIVARSGEADDRRGEREEYTHGARAFTSDQPEGSRAPCGKGGPITGD